MPDLEIAGGGGVGGIPTKYLLIGAGVLGVGAILLLSNRGGGGGGSGSEAQAALGPHATLALGSLESTSRQQFGELTQSLRDYFAEQGQQIGTGFQGIGDYQHGMQQSILGLYQQQLSEAGWTPDQITDWLRGKFPAYGLSQPDGGISADVLAQPIVH